jgi:hypothetical protein
VPHDDDRYFTAPHGAQFAVYDLADLGAETVAGPYATRDEARLETERRNLPRRRKEKPVTATVDPFDVELGPERDQWKRPLLVPPGGGERVAYTRMSTLAGFVCDDFGLSTWAQRLLAIGLAQREDLCAMIAALPALNDAKCDKKTLTKAQVKQDKDTKAKLDNYIEQALEAAGRNYKANHGTAVHGFIENGSVDNAPERMVADVQSCLDCFAERGIEVLCSEVFVVNEALRAAGSFDHLVRHPTYGVVVADVKTGVIDGKGLQFAIQLAGYAGGEVYDCETDTRAPLESLVGGEQVNRDLGLLCHVPLGGGRTDLYPVNLRRGRKSAELATRVRAERDYKDFLGPVLT